MKFSVRSALRAALLPALLGVASAVPDSNVRSELVNRSGTSESQAGGVVFFQGHVGGSGAPSQGGLKLQESSFGQSFPTWLPYKTHASEVATTIREALYPDPSLPRNSIISGGKPFRYKFLLFDLDGADITQDFSDIDQWFTSADREAIDAQVELLRAALVANPFDTGLRNLYLDIHYDLLVADIQSVKKKVVELGKIRLGLVTTSQFIIDEEIALSETIVAQLRDALTHYGASLGEGMDGIDPSDFDSSVPPDMPFGLYIFWKQQPRRNAVPSKFVGPAGGEQAVVGGDDPLPEDPANPNDVVLSAGYKDLNALLELMAHFVRQSNELSRLYGLRGASGDLAEARAAVSEVQGDVANDLTLLKSLFEAEQFLPGDSSGVRGAMSGLEHAVADAANVRAFLNGEANLLGLDENFLLIVPSSGGSFDSYDILAAGLKGPNKPLTIAIDKLGTRSPGTGARGAYDNYRVSLDAVLDELRAVEQNFANRYQKITGFLPDAGFDGTNATFSSELGRAQTNVRNLGQRLDLFDQQLAALDADQRHFNAAVKDAEAISGSIEEATETYNETATSAWDQIARQRSLAAAGQALADTALALAGLDGASTFFSGGGNAAAATAAGAANAALQAIAAGRITDSEATIDAAAVTFESEVAVAGSELVVTQANIALAEHRREITSVRIGQQGDVLALAQAQAEYSALLRELRRIEQNREVNVTAIRGKYFADPIHLIRADNAILGADAAFRNAQRWLFYTLRALQYKWGERFAHTSAGKSYDEGSIFQMRNAEELDALLTAMVDWDAVRNTQNTQNETVVISFRDHLLAANPADPNRLFPSFGLDDDGMRYDLPTGELVTQAEFFARRLAEHIDASGNLVIPFDTTLLENLGARFFRGPNYSTGAPGTYRDKIEWFAVNLVSPQGTAQPDLTTSPASVDYSGQTYFRTRIPPRVDRSQPSNLNQGGVLDLPGEFITSTFRKPVSLNFDNVFEMRSTATTNIGIAVNQGSAAGDAAVRSTLADVNNGFRQTAFKEYSVAATGWTLEIPAGTFPVGPGGRPDITDLEILIQHRSTDRVAPQ